MYPMWERGKPNIIDLVQHIRESPTSRVTITLTSEVDIGYLAYNDIFLRDIPIKELYLIDTHRECSLTINLVKYIQNLLRQGIHVYLDQHMYDDILVYIQSYPDINHKPAMLPASYPPPRHLETEREQEREIPWDDLLSASFYALKTYFSQRHVFLHMSAHSYHRNDLLKLANYIDKGNPRWSKCLYMGIYQDIKGQGQVAELEQIIADYVDEDIMEIDSRYINFLCKLLDWQIGNNFNQHRG